MTLPAFLDTCVLYPAYLCDTLLRLADAEVYRPLWSTDVLAELRRNLVEQGVDVDKVDYRIGQMRRSFPDAEVTGHEPLVEAMTNDPKDRHVLAAAILAGASVVITFNLRDFPDAAVKPHHLSPVHPDEFLLNQLEFYPAQTLNVLDQQAASYRREPTTIPGLLTRLERSGIPRFAAEVRRHLR